MKKLTPITFLIILLSSCFSDIRSALEIPMAIQKEVNAEAVHVTEASYEHLAAIHITLKDTVMINPNTDLFKIQSIAYKSAKKAYELYSKKHYKSINNYRIDIAHRNSFYRYYYYDSVQFSRKDNYWEKVRSFLTAAKTKKYDQLSRSVATGVDTVPIIGQLKNFDYGKVDNDYHFFALENIVINDRWVTRYWIRYGSNTNYQMIAVLLDPEKGDILDIALKPSSVITYNP